MYVQVERFLHYSWLLSKLLLLNIVLFYIKVKEVMETSHSINQPLSFSDTIAESDENSPSTRARRRWKLAIEQQMLLARLEKQNQSVISKWA